jgi:polyisoprenoid-binding protein YceI
MLKTSRLFSALALVLGTFTAATAATAAEYAQVVTEQSEIAFTFTQMNVKLTGTFKDFSAELKFDPQQPEQAIAKFEVQTASIATGSREADEEAVNADWFATADHPLARFESSAVRAVGEGQYEVDGELTIKGKSRPVTVPFSVSESGETAVLTANLEILRNDYAIGEGMWSDTSIVANEIQISVKLTTKP